MPIGDLLAQITGEPSPTSTNFPPTKRKANDDLRKPVERVHKLSTPAANSSRPVSNPRSSSGLDLKGKLPPIGNGNPSSATAFNNGQPTPPLSKNDAAKPLKKGSFAEIMARGKEAQKLMGQVGKIQHKKIEKLPGRREREEARLQRAGKIQKGLDPKSKFQKMGQAPLLAGRNGVKENGKVKKEVVPEKKIKKAALATTGYSGTARPKTAGSLRPNASSSMRRTDGYADRRGDSSRYTYVSEEEDEDEEEQEDYESDASSDMEAAVFEVDEEEELAARIARQEDAEALAEENRLKREKEAKKRKLMAMAKKAKPQSY